MAKDWCDWTPLWNSKGSNNYLLSDQFARSELEQPQAGPKGAAHGRAK